MIASILWDVDPVWFKVGSWEVRWYGIILARCSLR